MDKKDNINFDLDFLERNSKEKPKEQPKSKDPNWVYYNDNSGANGSLKSSDNYSGGMSNSAKKWAWGIGIVVVIAIVAVISGDSSTTPSTNTTVGTTSNGQVQNGGYKCSSSADAEARNLDPDVDNATINGIRADSIVLDRRSSTISAESARIDAEKDTADIDTYNADVDTYNTLLDKLKLDRTALNTRIDAYNASEQVYNNYLAQNCTKD